MRVLRIVAEFWDVDFFGGRKTGKLEETPLSEDENQQQTQPTYGPGPESNPGPINIDGRQALSLLYKG